MISTEKAMKMMDEYLDQHSGEIKSETDIERLIASFTKEYNASLGNEDELKTVYDYLDEADNAETKEEHMDALKKALAIEPDNPDVQMKIILAEKGDDADELLDALSALISKISGEKSMQNHLQHDVGSFWGILDTRPYMRVRQKYMDTLVECGMFTAAAEEGEELIKLNKADNLGIRFVLMSIYAFREDEKSAQALHHKYENADETQMLLPLAVLYYKKRKFKKAGEYLGRLMKRNKDTRDFFRKMSDKEESEKLLSNLPPYYTWFSIEELAAAVYENTFLYSSTPTFFIWGKRWFSRNGK